MKKLMINFLITVAIVTVFDDLRATFGFKSDTGFLATNTYKYSIAALMSTIAFFSKKQGNQNGLLET